MEINRTRYGMLSVSYIENDNSYHCVCDCGTKLILSEKQLNDNSSCGCVYRKLLLSLTGSADNSKDSDIPVSENTDERGIYFDKDKNKWRARITYQAKKYHLGYFPDKKSALEIRCEAEKNLGGNFIEWLNKLKSNERQS